MKKKEQRLDRTRPKVKPTFVLSAEVYLEWREAGEEGQRKLENAFDRAVLEIVEKHQIVASDQATDLRGWLSACTKTYFMMLFMGNRLPQKEESKRWDRIDAAFRVLSNELPQHYLAADYDPNPSRLRVVGDHFADLIKFIHDHAKATHEFVCRFDRPKTKNAAKPALRHLGSGIRGAWVGERWNFGKFAAAGVPLIASGSKYVQFATYTYAFLGEGRSERMIINRLKIAEREEETRAARNLVITKPKVTSLLPL